MSKKILFVLNSHLFTAKHRIPLINNLKQKKYQVICAVMENSEAGTLLKNNKIETVNWEVSRKGKNIFSELNSIYKLYKLYIKLKPDLLVHATIKPVIYGTIISYFAKIDSTINLITGLGSIFVREGFIAKVIKFLILKTYSIIFNLKKQKVIFQNKSDEDILINGRDYDKVDIIRIPGSGVKVDDFPNLPFPKELRITLIGRMIKEKGVDFFIETSKLIKKKIPSLKVTLVGPIDFGNPSFISEDYLISLNNNNIIEWWGEQEDMINVYKNSSIIVLPSFREGFPKTLIEAGLSGRPVLASDVPGCRDAIVNGITGYTFPLNDKKTYISQIINLINNKHKMKIMGQEGRKHVINNFSTDIVIPKMVAEIERSFAHAE